MRSNNVRFLSFLLAVALMMTAVFSAAAFPPLTGAAKAVPSSIRGDVNADGKLTTLDAREVLLYVLRAAEFDEQQVFLADINRDGHVDTADARQMLLMIAGIVTMPTEDIDLLVYDKIISTENTAVTEQTDGSWLITSTAAGQVAIDGPGFYDASILQWTHLSVSSTVPFVIWFYDETNSKRMDTNGDFSNIFGNPAPAGEYGYHALWTNGCYTWDGSALPETVDIQKIYIEPKAAGTMIIGHMMLSQQQTCDVPAPSLAMVQCNEKVNMTYTFTGDEKDKAGFAQGTIAVTPTKSTKTSGYYLVYYANTYGLLKEYDEVASIAITGGTVSHTVKDGAYLPKEATKLAVFESDSRFLVDHPSVETAVDIIDLSPDKTLDLGKRQYVIGATSDIHINFEGLGFGSEQKWKNTLNFFSKHEVDSVIITGDMTGDTNLDYEYGYYIDSINASDIPVENVYEAIGNHGNTASKLGLFTKYTSGDDEVHPFEGSPYYYVVKEGKTAGDRDNVFIVMAQELLGPSDSAIYDNFSKAQIDWLEETLEMFNKPDTNIFLIEHAPFWNWSPGDRYNGDYTRKITFKESYTQTMRLKRLLETYKNVIMMSGHTHLTFYENENYSDQYDTFCRMVHVSSGTQTSSYNHGDRLISDTDGRERNSPTYGSEGYIISVYEDYIVYTGYNISTGRIIPAGCLLIPTVPYGGSGGEVIDPTIKDVTGDKPLFDVIEGQGTAEDPYQIATAEHFKLFTDEFAKSTATDQTAMFGYDMYFKQTADIDMTGVEGYNGITAGGSTRYTFAGNYNGDGHTLKVAIDGGDQRSVFPYSYGVIANLRVEGSISGGTCAQVVRALYGQLINCVFHVDLNADQEAGAIYSNYGYVYNLYVSGTHSTGAAASPVAVNHNATKYHNVYYYRTQNGAAVSSPYGTQSNDLTAVAAALNSHSDSEYATALAYLSGYAMCEITVDNGRLAFVNGEKTLFDVIEGQGTAEDPYLIATAEHFKLLTDEFAKSTATDQTAMFGYGMYFKQTADIDMTGIADYNGITAGGSTRYTFAGNYNGDGHTLKVNIGGGDQRSVFPYSYGVIANLRVEGSISGGTCAQVVRALYGQLINCVFHVDLDADQEAGAIYSNYGYVYNLYVSGTHSTGAAASPVAVNHNATKYHNVYYYRTQNGAAVSSPYGTQSNDLTAVAAALNSHSDSEYATALAYLNGYAMCEITVDNGQLTF